MRRASEAWRSSHYHVFIYCRGGARALLVPAYRLPVPPFDGRRAWYAKVLTTVASSGGWKSVLSARVVVVATPGGFPPLWLARHRSGAGMLERYRRPDHRYYLVLGLGSESVNALGFSNRVRVGIGHVVSTCRLLHDRAGAARPPSAARSRAPIRRARMAGMASARCALSAALFAALVWPSPSLGRVRLAFLRRASINPAGLIGASCAPASSGDHAVGTWSSWCRWWWQRSARDLRRPR